MESVKDEIQAAISKLGLLESDIRLLSNDVAKEIYHGALRKFVGGFEPKWWWEHFAAFVSVDFPEGDGWNTWPSWCRMLVNRFGSLWRMTRFRSIRCTKLGHPFFQH